MLDLDAKPAAADAVLSLVKLREVHGDLTREYGNFPDKPSREFLAKAAAFQAAASTAGTEISSIDERLEIQSRINFWQSARINAGQRPQTVLLAAFDREAAKRAAGNKAPYKGLAAFQTDDAKNFSGRYEIVVKLVKDVLTHRLLAVIGLSGSGKSSVVRAGLIPQLAEGAYDGVDDGDLTASSGWTYPQPILPGTDPLAALEAVYGEIATPDDLPKALDRLGAPVLLSIDQFEEVFTLSEPSERRNRFIDALCAAATSGVHRHMVVVTMRSDYIERVKAHPAFAAAVEDCTTVIQSMQASDLRKAIEEPAARLGVGFEPGLVDKLQTSVQGEPAGLPLLSFTLLKLWEMRADGPMKLADYEALGGNPRVILTKSADKLFDDLIPEKQRIVKETFTRLVKINDTLDATSNRIKRRDLDVLGQPVAVDPALQLLLRNNLIRTSPAGDITPATDIEVGHEALIRNWGRLTEWVKESFAEQTNRKAFALRAERWKPADKNADLLSGFALEEAKGFQLLTDKEKLYIAASKARARRREIWRWSAIAALVVLVLLLMSAIFYIVRKNRAEQAATTLSSLITLSDSLIEQGEFVLAKKVMVLGLKAGDPPPPPMRAALQAAQLNELTTTTLTVRGGGAAKGVSISQDGSQLMSLWGDGSARIWRRNADVKNGWLPTPIELAIPGRTITAVALSPDGKTALSASRVKANPYVGSFLERWTLAEDSKPIYKRPPYQILDVLGGERIGSIKFSPDGKSAVLAIQTGSGLARVIASDTGKVLADLLTGSNGAVKVAIFSSRGDKILVADDEGSIVIYDAKTFELLPESGLIWANQGSINSAQFTDTGARFAAGTAKGPIVVYTVVDGQKLFQLPGHAKGVASVAFAPDSAMIASASPDGTVRLWEHGITSGRLLRTLTTGARAVTSVAFMPDGERLVLSTDNGKGDGTIQVVDFNGGKFLGETRLLPKDKTTTSSWIWASENNKVVATEALDKEFDEKTFTQSSRLELWDVESGQRLMALPKLHDVSSTFLSANGARFAVVHELVSKDPEKLRERVLDIYSAGDNVRLARIPAPYHRNEDAGPKDPERQSIFFEIAMSADGKTLAAVTDIGQLLIWNGGPAPTLVSLAKGHPYLTEYGMPLLKFSKSDPKRFVFVSQGSNIAVVHDGVTGKEIFRIKTLGTIETLDFTPDGTGLFIGTGIGTGAIWDAQTGELRTLLRGRHDNAIISQRFDKSGTLLLTASIDGTARLWDARTGQLRHVLISPLGSIDGVFSDNGRYVVTGSESRIATVWDVATGKRLTGLAGPSKSGGSIGWFANNDTEVVTLAEDTTLRRWRIVTPDMDYDALFKAACADGRDNFTAEEVQRLGLEKVIEAKGGRLPTCPPVAKRVAARSVSPPPN